MQTLAPQDVCSGPQPIMKLVGVAVDNPKLCQLSAWLVVDGMLACS